MRVEEFNKVVDEVLAEVRSRLISKGKEYTPGYDRLGNFKKQARIMGSTPLLALKGNVVKHEAWADDMRIAETSVIPWSGIGSIMEHHGDIICYAILEMAALRERNQRLVDMDLCDSTNEYSSKFYELPSNNGANDVDTVD